MSELTERLAAIRERLEVGLQAAYDHGRKRQEDAISDEQLRIYACASDVPKLLASVEAVLKKCDDCLKWERESPKEPFEFGMAEAARDMQSILTEHLGAGDE